jgi:hypothetical protein
MLKVLIEALEYLPSSFMWLCGEFSHESPGHA